MIRDIFGIFIDIVYKQEIEDVRQTQYHAAYLLQYCKTLLNVSTLVFLCQGSLPIFFSLLLLPLSTKALLYFFLKLLPVQLEALRNTI